MTVATPAADAVLTDNRLTRHIHRTIVLALPVIVSRVGLIGMSAIDVIVLGRAGAGPLADYVLGQAIYDSLIAATMGLLLGVPVLAAKRLGAGEGATLGAIWRRGLFYGLLVGLGFALLLQAAEPFFLLIGQEPGLAGRAGAVTATLGLALPGIALYAVSAMFLEAIHRPMPGMIAVLIANIVNLALNIVLVFGVGPLPGLGAVGCAIATAITMALLALGLALYIRYGLGERRAYAIDRPAGRLWRDAGEQRRLGYSSGVSFTLEAGSFSAITMLVGWLGALALATHGVLFQFLALTFMVAHGLATATQVRVGNAWGRQDPVGMARAGWTGLGLTTIVTASASALYLLLPGPLVGLFTPEEEIRALAIPVLVWVALALICDGGQSVMNNACRGRGDTWVPTAFHFVSYWCLMVPLAWWFAHPLGHGLAGIYQGIVVASVFSLTALAGRFAWLSRRI